MTDITKLPKWAQAHIQTIQRQRDNAVRALNNYCDSQTESPFRVREWEYTGEERGSTTKVRYIQSHTMEVLWKGVELSIILRPKEDGMDLQWSAPNRIGGLIAFVPTSHQSARLVNPKEVTR